MSGKLATKVKVDFRIKLLSGNNVVMVEAGGYESEIFVPMIINGRIGFQNIIPNRRCCTSRSSQYNRNNSNVRCLQNLTPLRESKQQQYTPPTNISTSSKAIRMSAGQDIRLSPLAYSTPATGTSTAIQTPKNSRRLHRHRSRLSVSQSFSNTPEPPRRDVKSVYDVVKDTLVQIPSGIKVIRLYRNPTSSNPHKNVLRVVSTNTESPVPRAQSVDLLRKPRHSPIPTQTEHAFTPLNEAEVSEFHLPATPDLKCRFKHNKPTQSPYIPTPIITKWRKCITPIRTYSRRNNSVVTKKALNNSPIRSSNRAMPTVRLGGKVLPSFMINPTQSAKSTVHLEVKKRRVVIDPKLTITPRTFKKQQRDTSDLKNNTKYRLPRNRKEYQASKMSAFEMLTNSNRVRNMSLKLNGQFRKGCINKASSTNPRYKQLCSIPPLQQDQQTRDISRQSCENTNAQFKPSQQSQTLRNQNMIAITKLKIPEPLTK